MPWIAGAVGLAGVGLGAADAAGAFSDDRLPWFGLTNIDETHFPLMSLIGFGQGSGGDNSLLGQGNWVYEDGHWKTKPNQGKANQIRKHNLLDVLTSLQPEQAKRINNLRRQSVGMHAQGMSDLDSLIPAAQQSTQRLQRQATGNTQNILGQARANQSGLLGEISGLFDARRQEIEATLGDTLQNIARQSNLRDAASGLKTTRSSARVRAGQGNAARGAVAQLSQLADAEIAQRAGARERTGRDILKSISGRAQAEEGLASQRAGVMDALRRFGFQGRQQLLGGKLSRGLQFLDLEKNNRLMVPQALLNFTNQIPIFNQPGRLAGPTGLVQNMSQGFDTFGGIAQAFSGPSENDELITQILRNYAGSGGGGGGGGGGGQTTRTGYDLLSFGQ